jgi:hypothetical protein
MRKILVILLIIPVFFLFIIGLVLFDYIYYPLISSKAEKTAEKSLEKKYGEDFVIDEASFSKPLGDDIGTYRIDAHPANSPKLTVRISVTEDMEAMSDDYLEMKWRAELNDQFGSIYTELYGTRKKYSYMVNASFPENAQTKYNKSNTYQDIFEQDQELEYFSIDINYFNKKLQQEISSIDKKLNYNDFSSKHLKLRDYVFHFSYDSGDGGDKNRLDELKSSADLKQYLRETKK